MELRDIEVFLALADELHFGRTADRLHLTPARVSQIVKQAEQQVGGALFERTSRRVSLTPLGEQLRDELAGTYVAIQDAFERARRSAQDSAGVLTLGTITWRTELLEPALQRLAGRMPNLEVLFRTIPFSNPFGDLRSGEIDAAILWLPVREPDLTVGPLLGTESIVLAMSASHVLADAETLSLEDLAHVTVMGGARPEYWREGLVPTRTPSGRTIPIGPMVSTTEEMIPILTTGEAVSPMHAHTAEYLPLPGVVYRPIDDAPPAQWVLVWRTAAEDDRIRALADAIRASRSSTRPMAQRKVR